MPAGSEIFILFAVMIGGMYFLMIRPQKKRAAEQQAKIAALGEGSRIMLTSGIFGTIRHLGEKQAIVELAPGSEITILRQAIAREALEDEDEFEYTDEVAIEADEVVPAEDLSWAEQSFARPEGDDADKSAKRDPKEEDRGTSA